MKRPKRDYKLEQKVGDPRKTKTEDYKRSDHNDFATSLELRERKFSGMRMNTISQQWELWVLGEVKEIIKAPHGKPSDADIEDVFKRVFGLY